MCTKFPMRSLSCSFIMSDPKQTKVTKSKSRKSPVKGHPSTSSGNVNNNRSISSTAVSHQGSAPLALGTSSIMGKIDMENLKQATFRNVKSSLGSPSARDECINYALEMVISNLIINGRLDPSKAQSMRTPLMKAQIASICDKMLKNRAKKTAIASKSSTSGTGAKKTKSGTGSSRSKPKTQKWAIQPAALPITIVTDPSNAFNPMVELPSPKAVSKKASTGSFKACEEASSENLKRKGRRKKCKSLDSSSNSNTKTPTEGVEPQNQKKQPSAQQQTAANVSQNGKKKVQEECQQCTAPPLQAPTDAVKAIPTLAPLKANPPSAINKLMTYRQESSEVPSYQSFEYNNSNLINKEQNKIGDPPAEHPSIKADRTVQFEGSVVEKYDKDYRISSPPLPENDSAHDSHANGDKVMIPFTPAPFSAESRCESAGGESRHRSPKRLNTLISSSSSLSDSNSNSNGFQILVDMKGFNNEEISMEVEVDGRQLIFLASRPKRNDLNMRKVTEIVDVPPGVNLENLRIGRRVDGYVIVEEYDIDG